MITTENDNTPSGFMFKDSVSKHNTRQFQNGEFSNL